MFRNTKLVTLLLVITLVVINVTAAFAAAPVQQEDQTIVDIAVEDGRFTTLVTALEAAGLVETLSGEGPFTVFAPTDEAFAALPDGTLDDLLADTAALTDVLLYHVVDGEVLAADVVTLDSADTLLGESVDVTVDGDTVMVNEANVTVTDIQGSNGVIHVIDAVLLPPADEAMMAEEEAMAEEEMAEGEMAEEGDMAEEEAMAEEAPAEEPATLPQSGGEMSTGMTTIIILSVLGLALVLGGVALRFRSVA